MPDTGARRSWWSAGIGRDGVSSREPARRQGDAVGLVNERLSGMGESAAVPIPVASPFDRRVIWVGGIVFVVLVALSARYGFDRDELYFLDGARHLQASYVDQPVIAPLLAWVSLKLFGMSLPGLRVWPALAAWATVVAGGLIAREFGGGKRAQLLAAIGTATMPVLLGPLMWPTRPPTSCWGGRAWRWSWPGSGGPATAAGGWPEAWSRASACPTTTA
jgi:hypothetical protein